MEEDIIEKVPVNWNALDALVLDYAEAEQLLVGSEKNMTSFVLRSTISHIRRLVEQGSISEALDLLQLHAPSALQDQRLLFQLHKQKFIELLRIGGLQAQDEAIQCCRTVLGPSALTAYPEAYEEFKRLLLALIYNKDDTSSPIVQEWSESKRVELAATVASVLKAQLRAYEPLFSLALRYLVSTHNSYCSRQGVASPIADVSNALVDKEKDPPATPHDCLLEAPKFDESDVQALAHAVDLSRQGAVDSLRYAGGDLNLAFKNELSRIKINTSVLDDLVHGYCVYRGLIDATLSSVPRTCSEVIDIVPELTDEHGSSARDEREGSDVSVEHNCNEADLQNNSGVCKEQKRLVTDGEDAAMEDQGDALSEHSIAGESARSDSCTASESICSTSGCVALEQRQTAIWRKLQSSCARKRWAGRPMLSQCGNQKVTLCGERQFRPSPGGYTRANNELSKLTTEEGSDDKFGLALEIKEMACEGMILEVIQKVKRLNPQFFEYNPHLLFQLKQMEFLKLVEVGNYTEALSVARCDMGPLAAKHTDLLKPLKETVLALARPQGEQVKNSISPSILGATLQVALSASLGVSEPALMKIMKVTLHAHNEWFKLQMCADTFAEMLSINTLKDTDCVSLGSVCHNNIPETSTVTSKLGPSNISSLSNDGSLPQQSESSRDGAIFDDSSILTLMEWMAIPRGDAIQLLAQYDGNVETVFEHMLS
eukprot:c10963_g1_i1 orf=536-2674(-)